MMKAIDLFNYIDSYAPVETQMDFDNSGFLFGSKNADVSAVLLALDVTGDVIREAMRENVQLIVTHHPLIFHPVKNMLDDSADGRKLLALARSGISVISMHTNLDLAEGGVNDALIRQLNVVSVSRSAEEPMMRVGELAQPCVLSEYLKFLKVSLSCNGLRYVDGGHPVHRVACLGGAGEDALTAAVHEGCDTFVTGDVRYHVFLNAKELGVNLIDADHFCTENPVIYDLKDRLSENFPTVRFKISEVHRQTTRFYTGEGI